MPRAVLPVLLPLVLAAAGLRADDALVRTAPLAPPPGPSPARLVLTEEAAARAQDLGFPSVAASLYRDLLAARAGDPAATTLALATALLDDGRAAEAEQVLAQFPGPQTAGWHLRMAMVAIQESRTDLLQAQLAAVQPAELAPAERPWFFFLQGQVAEHLAGDPARAARLYRQAEAAAPNELARAQFLLRDEDNRLRLGRIDPKADVDDARQRAEQAPGTAVGYDQVRHYAVVLNAVGRKAEAEAVLQRQLSRLPGEERAWADNFRLLLGLIGGAGEGPGRAALTQLLESGDPDHRRMALQLLAGASLPGPSAAGLRAELDKLAAAKDPGAVAILESVLLFRAEFALRDNDYAGAEESARRLADGFPASALRPYAQAVLAGSAWEQRRFRAAAAAAQKARDAASGALRARYAVLAAEAWFRAGDFRSAADAYAAALLEKPPGAAPADLMFQQVQSDLSAGDLAAAAAALADFARDPAFGAVTRWQAEWNFARALQLAGRADEAYRRVSDILAEGRRPGAPALPAELRVRMAWLQARLSYDAGRYADTLAEAGGLTGALDGVEPALRAAVAGTASLLVAQADFALSRDGEAHLVLKRLRDDFPSSEAAAYSYLAEADHYAEGDQVVEALRLLTQLAEKLPSSAYAPYALYRAALLSERLGHEQDLRNANNYLESLLALVARNPGAGRDLVFYARLKQGDLSRELNLYPRAELDYAYLVTNFPGHRDAPLAQLALAECINAESTSDPSRAEQAADRFEHLCQAVDNPPDVRVEAGFNLGALHRRRGRPDDAEKVWWGQVVSPFLLDPAGAARLGARGRYWMSRTLVELGDLKRQRGRLEEAKAAWELVVSRGLPYADIARQRLAPFHLP